VRSVGVVVVSCSGRPGRRDKEEEGPIGFLAGGGPKFEVTPLDISYRYCRTGRQYLCLCVTTLSQWTAGGTVTVSVAAVV